MEISSSKNFIHNTSKTHVRHIADMTLCQFTNNGIYFVQWIAIGFVPLLM